jgi:hypothetical protein
MEGLALLENPDGREVQESSPAHHAPLHAANRGAHPAGQEHAAVRVLPLAGTATSRSARRRLSPHHLVPRPTGRDGALHGDAACRQGDLSRSARQRQPRSPSRRRGGRPPLGAPGKTRSPSRATCSPWSPASSTVLRDTFTSPRRAARCNWRSTSNRASSTSARTPWNALKKSMRWDEERFGLECDLDHYMIVAVGDFNMGAMENKGLNIFNTKYVLARPDTATDVDFENIDRVVAHEYFHNWTGNRVTCRDWFQLSLKEGLTVFRDQEFGADTHSASVAHPRSARPARRAVPGGRRPDGASGAPRQLRRDQQFLHRDRVREGRRSHPHDPHADRPRGLPRAWTSTSSATTARR